MQTFFRSFYLKLSAIFLVLLLGMGIAQIFITIDSSREFQIEVDQTLNLDLARDMVPDFEPFLADSINIEGMKDMIHYMMVINPKIEIYLLDDRGTIRAFFTGPGKDLDLKQVDLAPVRRFIAGDPDTPILGDDPRNAGRQKVFSAAPLHIGDRLGYLYVVVESELYDTAARNLRGTYMIRTIIRGLVISLAVTGLIGLLLFALLTRRLRRMTGVVEDFEKGNLSERIPVKSSDELAHLAQAFNLMADTIIANMDELKKTDQLRRELVANISHDLRSPMASIKAYIETILIKDPELEPQERRKYLETVLNISNLLESTVDQLFQLSKLDAAQIQPQLEPFSIAELVQDIVMKFLPMAEKAGICLEADFPPQIPQAHADIGLIERALSNLLDNALRYTPAGGRVTVRLIQQQRKIMVQVSDTGCGIAREELPLIFDRFYRVEKSRTRTTGGAGLGLAITQKILEIHQSQITVESEVGKGTTFTFSLKAWQGKQVNGLME